MKNPAIKTVTKDDLVFADKFGDDEIWLSIHVRHGSASATLTKEQAQELIDQLTELVNPSDDEPAEQDPEPPYRARSTYSQDELQMKHWSDRT